MAEGLDSQQLATIAGGTIVAWEALKTVARSIFGGGGMGSPKASEPAKVKPDPAKEFAESVTNMGVGGMHANAIGLGEELGLFKAFLEHGPALSHSELAKVTTCNDRYMKEWCLAMASIRVLIYDEPSNKFQIRPEIKPAFLDPSALVFAHTAGAVTANRPKLAEIFKTGGGIPWGDNDERLFEGTCRFFKPLYEGNLVNVVPPDVRKAFESGATVADVGCGFGLTSFLLGEAFPKSTFIGYDYHKPSVQEAEVRRAARGVHNVSFEHGGGDSFGSTNKFEVVMFFDCWHDMSVASKAARRAYQTLKQGGFVFIIEPMGAEEDSVTAQLALPTAPVFTFFSIHVCLPCGICNNGDALGTVAPTSTHRRIFTSVGFKSLESIPSTINEMGFRVLLARK